MGLPIDILENGTIFADYKFRAGPQGLVFIDEDYPLTLDKFKWNDGDTLTVTITQGQITLYRNQYEKEDIQ